MTSYSEKLCNYQSLSFLDKLLQLMSAHWLQGCATIPLINIYLPLVVPAQHTHPKIQDFGDPIFAKAMRCIALRLAFGNG